MLSFSALIFIIFFAALQDRIVTANLRQANQDLNRAGNLIFSEVRLAQRFGNGYSREFFLPDNINGLTFNASIRNQTTLIMNSSIANSYFFFDNPVVGQPKQGSNTLFHIAGYTYINRNLSDILTVKIDGQDTDWQALQQWQGILAIRDDERDAFIPEGNPIFDYDLKSLILWNDNDWLYFKFDIYSEKIADYQQTGLENNYWDVMLLLDTDVLQSTGYYNSDESELISPIGADYAIFDQTNSVAGSVAYEYNYNRPVAGGLKNQSTHQPYVFDGAGQTDWKWNKSSDNLVIKVKFGLINNNAYEGAVRLDALNLNPSDEPVISYSLVSRLNNSLITDYIPGQGDSIESGFYQIKNR